MVVSQVVRVFGILAMAIALVMQSGAGVSETDTNCTYAELKCDILKNDDLNSTQHAFLPSRDNESFTLAPGGNWNFTCNWEPEFCEANEFKWALNTTTGWRILLRAVSISRRLRVIFENDRSLDDDETIFDSLANQELIGSGRFLSDANFTSVYMSRNKWRDVNMTETFHVLASTVRVTNTILLENCSRCENGDWTKTGYHYSTSQEGIGSGKLMYTCNNTYPASYEDILLSFSYVLQYGVSSYITNGTFKFICTDSTRELMRKKWMNFMPPSINASCERSPLRITFKGSGKGMFTLENITVNLLVYKEVLPSPSLSTSTSSTILANSTAPFISETSPGVGNGTGFSEKTTDINSRANSSVSKANITTIAPASAVAAVVLLVVVIIIVVVCRKRRRSVPTEERHPMKVSETGDRDCVPVTNPGFDPDDAEAHEYSQLSIPEIHPYTSVKANAPVDMKVFGGDDYDVLFDDNRDDSHENIGKSIKDEERSASRVSSKVGSQKGVKGVKELSRSIGSTKVMDNDYAKVDMQKKAEERKRQAESEPRHNYEDVTLGDVTYATLEPDDGGFSETIMLPTCDPNHGEDQRENMAGLQSESVDRKPGAKGPRPLSLASRSPPSEQIPGMEPTMSYSDAYEEPLSLLSPSAIKPLGRQAGNPVSPGEYSKDDNKHGNAKLRREMARMSSEYEDPTAMKRDTAEKSPSFKPGASVDDYETPDIMVKDTVGETTAMTSPDLANPGLDQESHSYEQVRPSLDGEYGDLIFDFELAMPSTATNEPYDTLERRRDGSLQSPRRNATKKQSSVEDAYETALPQSNTNQTLDDKESRSPTKLAGEEEYQHLNHPLSPTRGSLRDAASQRIVEGHEYGRLQLQASPGGGSWKDGALTNQGIAEDHEYGRLQAQVSPGGGSWKDGAVTNRGIAEDHEYGSLQLPANSGVSLEDGAVPKQSTVEDHEYGTIPPPGRNEGSLVDADVSAVRGDPVYDVLEDTHGKDTVSEDLPAYYVLERIN